MKKRAKLAIPSMAPGGVAAMRSGHFGRCDCFTVAVIEDGKPTEVFVVENPPHVEGGCLGPVKLLATRGVDAIIVSGIGMRPLIGFRDNGIEVYLGEGDTVGDALGAFAAGTLRPIDDEAVCGGHGS